MWPSLLKSSWKYVAVAIVAGLITWKLLPPKIEIREKIVTEVQERVRVDTRIIERPDGTTETIISERRDTDTSVVSERESKPAGTEWIVGLRASGSKEPIYSLSIERSLILGLSAGLYARTDKEVGLAISYSF